MRGVRACQRQVFAHETTRKTIMSNLKTLMEIYEAFGRGDLPAILARFSDTIEWEYGATASNIPWVQRREGKAGAEAGLVSTFTNMETHRFVPKAFIEGDGVIVVLYDTEFTVRATGKRVVEEDAAHIWRFDNEGKVSRFRHRADSLQQHLACTPD
jgi:ketosteroid isomerase-like protein